MKENRNQENEIDLLELAIECGHHWKRILLSTVVVAAIAFIASVTLMTPMYSSTAKLYVLSSSTSITSLADIQIGSNLASDYTAVVNSRPVLDQVITNLNLEDEDYQSLGSRITVTNPSDTRILEIEVTDSDAEMAKSIADETAEVSAAFIADKMNQDPPSVLQYGYVATDPVSPDVKKNTAIGAVVGFILAVAIVTVGFLLNDTIFTSEDLEKKLELNTLASIPMGNEEYDGQKNKKHRRGNKKKTASKKADKKETHKHTKDEAQKRA